MLKISRLIPFSKKRISIVYTQTFIYKNRKFSGWMNPLMKNNTNNKQVSRSNLTLHAQKPY